MDIRDNLRTAFNALGKRFTSQRQRVWELIATHPAGLTIREAAEALKSEGIGHTTVYRTVKELTDLEYLKWVHTDDGEHRFVAATGCHCHPLVCRGCGKVQLVDCQGMAILHTLIAVETGFAVEGHHLEVFGTCPECLGKKRLLPEVEGGATPLTHTQHISIVGH